MLNCPKVLWNEQINIFIFPYRNSA